MDKMIKKPVRITEIRNEGKNVKTFFFDEKMHHVSPGRFVSAWIPGYGEKPFSISYDNPLAITVKRIEKDPSNPIVGRFTNKMFELKERDRVWISGPRGNGFPIRNFHNRNVCIVAGGTGTVPVALLSQKTYKSKIISFLGAKTVDELIMGGRFAGEIHIATEDGSYGEKDLVTDVLEKYDLSSIVDPRTKAAVCGPEKMMYKSVKILEKHLDRENIYVCLERLMKRGIGLCGSCEIGGYRICADGPVLTAKKLEDVPDFGNFKRDRCGRKEYL